MAFDDEELSAKNFTILGIGCCVLSVIGCCCAIAIVALIVAFAVVIAGVNYVNYDQYGVNYNIYTQYIEQTVYEPGRYYTGVGYKFLHFPKMYQTIEFSNAEDATGTSLKSRTFDGLSITLEVSYQYRLNKDNVFKVFDIFATNFEPVYIKISRDVVRDVASNYNATQFFDERRRISQDMLSSLNTRLGEVHAEVGYFQLRSIDLVDAYEQAIEEKEIVRQEILKAQFERQSKLVAAETEVLVASKEAQVVIISANADAQATIINAEGQANATKTLVEAETGSYSTLKSSLSFNTTELLSYIWIKTIKDHDSSKLIVNLDKPAMLELD
mmetsp:Transcript_7060/g.10384  ORF Transcript_7060/g.10384 Transcript_7060/m.10384 type:complete len:328 (+) Transcript_7060:27-1010(+)